MSKTSDVLIKQNQRLINTLNLKEIPYKKIIYVTTDQPGSSSQLMLNLLRDGGQLEKKGVYFIDSHNLLDLVKVTSDLGSGAIIYVDDFVGTGNQFLSSRNFVAERVPLLGQFSEFLLLVSICKEGFASISKAGVEVICDHIHNESDRPLHSGNINFDNKKRKKILEHCLAIDSNHPLGYKGLASMVVFYRNTPNTVPVIIRGNVGQDNKFGILPRTTDLYKS